MTKLKGVDRVAKELCDDHSIGYYDEVTREYAARIITKELRLDLVEELCKQVIKSDTKPPLTLKNGAKATFKCACYKCVLARQIQSALEGKK